MELKWRKKTWLHVVEISIFHFHRHCVWCIMCDILYIMLTKRVNIVWCTGNVVTTSVFNALSISGGPVAAVNLYLGSYMCTKSTHHNHNNWFFVIVRARWVRQRSQQYALLVVIQHQSGIRSLLTVGVSVKNGHQLIARPIMLNCIYKAEGNLLGLATPV